jgi:formylglycine-generating enzyme required for sulfatase activity
MGEGELVFIPKDFLNRVQADPGDGSRGFPYNPDPEKPGKSTTELVVIEEVMPKGQGKLIITMAGDSLGAVAFIQSPRGGVVEKPTPVRINNLAPGTYRVTLKKPMYYDKQLSPNVGVGYTKVTGVALNPHYGFLTLTSDPSGARVYLDGHPIGETPIRKKQLLSRSYDLLVRNDPLYHDKKTSVTITDLTERKVTVKLPPAFATLVVKTDPPDALVTITGVTVTQKTSGSKGLVEERLSSGTYHISVTKELYRPKPGIRVNLKEGQTLEKTVQLKPDFGTLSITTRPSGALVSFAGGKRLTSPVKEAKLSPGTYGMTLEKEGFEPKIFTLTIAAGSPVRMDETLERKTGLLSIEVDPMPSDLKLYVNNQLIKNASLPDTLKDIPEGLSIIQCKGTIQGKPYEGKQTVSVAWNRETSVQIKLKPSGPQKGDIWIAPVKGMEFVWVRGGCFQMGSNSGDSDEKPVHKVCVDGFWMGKTEVTNRQYRQFKPGHDSKDYRGVNLNGDHQPVVYVSWDDAGAYAKWLSRKTGQKLGLPTEAQWEYAARAGTNTIRYWGDAPDDACRYANVHDDTSKKKFSDFTWEKHNCNDGYAGTAPVASFVPNKFGLYDMLGNVWEWCEDVYDENAYSRLSRNNPVITSGGDSRVSRGGSWYNSPGYVRAALRLRIPADSRGYFLGFRLCLSRVRQ